MGQFWKLRWGQRSVTCPISLMDSTCKKIRTYSCSSKNKMDVSEMFLKSMTTAKVLPTILVMTKIMVVCYNFFLLFFFKGLTILSLLHGSPQVTARYFRMKTCHIKITRVYIHTLHMMCPLDSRCRCFEGLYFCLISFKTNHMGLILYRRHFVYFCFFLNFSFFLVTL